jgi:hypothetical protein
LDLSNPDRTQLRRNRSKQFFWKVIDAKVLYNRVAPDLVKQSFGSSFINFFTTTTVDPFQNPELTFPYKKTVSEPEKKDEWEKI